MIDHQTWPYHIATDLGYNEATDCIHRLEQEAPCAISGGIAVPPGCLEASRRAGLAKRLADCGGHRVPHLHRQASGFISGVSEYSLEIA